MSRLLLISFSGLCLGLSFAQTPAPRQKKFTAEQKQYQADMAGWNQRIKEIHAQGESALSSEMAREKQPLCPDADNTRSQEICLQAEGDRTEANYESFAAAIRSTLALPAPTLSASQPTVAGPTGVPLSPAQFVAEFDHNEQEWKRYKADQAQAAFDQYKGGTLAPVFEGEAQLQLTRLPMRELAFIYGWKLGVS